MIRLSKIEHNVRSLLPELSAYFATRPEVEFAYLFGSYGEGSETPLSDLDIAVFFSDGLLGEDRIKSLVSGRTHGGEHFDIRLKMMADISHLLKTDEIDLVILNEADLCLSYQVVSTREVLFERNPTLRTEFEAQILDRYLDSEPVRRVQNEYFLQRIKDGLVFG